MAFRRVWALRDEHGFATCGSRGDPARPVLLFWSDSSGAERARAAGFEHHEPTSLTLFDFLFRGLAGMSRDRVLVGPNWTRAGLQAELTGIEVEPLILQEAIEDEVPPDLLADYLQRLRFELAMMRRGKR